MIYLNVHLHVVKISPSNSLKNYMCCAPVSNKGARGTDLPPPFFF